MEVLSYSHFIHLKVRNVEEEKNKAVSVFFLLLGNKTSEMPLPFIIVVCTTQQLNESDIPAAQYTCHVHQCNSFVIAKWSALRNKMQQTQNLSQIVKMEINLMFCTLTVQLLVAFNKKLLHKTCNLLIKCYRRNVTYNKIIK